MGQITKGRAEGVIGEITGYVRKIQAGLAIEVVGAAVDLDTLKKTPLRFSKAACHRWEIMP